MHEYKYKVWRWRNVRNKANTTNNWQNVTKRCIYYKSFRSCFAASFATFTVATQKAARVRPMYLNSWISHLLQYTSPVFRGTVCGSIQTRGQVRWVYSFSGGTLYTIRAFGLCCESEILLVNSSYLRKKSGLSRANWGWVRVWRWVRDRDITPGRDTLGQASTHLVDSPISWIPHIDNCHLLNNPSSELPISRTPNLVNTRIPEALYCVLCYFPCVLCNVHYAKTCLNMSRHRHRHIRREENIVTCRSAPTQDAVFGWRHCCTWKQN